MRLTTKITKKYHKGHKGLKLRIEVPELPLGMVEGIVRTYNRMGSVTQQVVFFEDNVTLSLSKWN